MSLMYYSELVFKLYSLHSQYSIVIFSSCTIDACRVLKGLVATIRKMNGFLVTMYN